MWDKVFKNGPIKILGRQPLKNLKGYGLSFTKAMSQKKFIWSILEYFVPCIIPKYILFYIVFPMNYIINSEVGRLPYITHYNSHPLTKIDTLVG